MITQTGYGQLRGSGSSAGDSWSILLCLLGLLLTPVFPGSALAQLSTLSAGNPALEWQKSQREQLEMQLSDDSIQSPLRDELQAQLKWLAAWQPGTLSDQPFWPAPKSIAATASEPVVDPSGISRELRARLLGPTAQPTEQDTTELQQMLATHSADVGLRQLHLHWLDQRQYRKLYPDEIADAALRLAGLLEQLTSTADIQLAKEYCYYRRTRALAYRELPEVLRDKPIVDVAKHQAELLGAYQQLIAVAGAGRPEFVLAEIRMLRRDQFYGRALSKLTDYASSIEKEWFLKKQRDLLRELGWEAPAGEAAKIYAQAFPQQAARELAEQALPKAE